MSGAVLAVALALSLAMPTAQAQVQAEARTAADAAVHWEELPRTWGTPGPVTATAYVLMDAETGQILAERQPDLRLVVASTVKVLTVLTALDHVAPDTLITVGAEVQVGGAGVGLDPGEQWLVEDLLEAVVARSGNDAARALAVHVGGSIDGFVRMMRAKADALGLRAPVIEDPSGLDDSNRLSARDLAVITRAALGDDRFRRISQAPLVDLPSLGSVETRNLLLARYAGATGVKTGYTDLAGWCLIGSAQRDGRELIAVILDARTDEDRFTDAERLLDFGFLDHVPAAGPVELRLRTAGGFVDHVLPVPRVWFPAEEPGTIEVAVPIDPTDPSTVTATWQGHPVGQWGADVIPPETPIPAGTGSLGATLTDAMYRSMRAAHRAGLWSAGAPAGR